jgi:hypothetical protein
MVAGRFDLTDKQRRPVVWTQSKLSVRLAEAEEAVIFGRARRLPTTPRT